MSLAGGMCAIHREVPATFACPRCGDFACAQCSHRAHPQSPPMCGTCWGKRGERLQTLTREERLYKPNVAFWLGVLSLVPFIWPAQVAGIVVSIVCLRRIAKDPQKLGKKRCIAGLVMSCLGAIVTVLCIALG